MKFKITIQLDSSQTKCGVHGTQHTYSFHIFIFQLSYFPKFPIINTMPPNHDTYLTVLSYITLLATSIQGFKQDEIHTIYRQHLVLKVPFNIIRMGAATFHSHENTNESTTQNTYSFLYIFWGNSHSEVQLLQGAHILHSASIQIYHRSKHSAHSSCQKKARVLSTILPFRNKYNLCVPKNL